MLFSGLPGRLAVYQYVYLYNQNKEHPNQINLVHLMILHVWHVK